MTISRCDRLVGCVWLAFALGGCNSAPTKPVKEIVAFNLSDDELGEQLGQRLLKLSEDKASFSKELSEAGFKHRRLPYSRSCGAWDYPVANENDPRALRAFVRYCDDGPNEVELKRFGIARHPMTYES